MSDLQNIFGVKERPGFLVGCEFELESVASAHPPSELFAETTEDNSLRNRGYEFITKPLTVEKAIKAHSLLWQGVEFKFENLNEACTDRCSTHIHVNFSDQSLEKIKQFIRLYALTEPIFFELADSTRQNNIYCVPLSATHMLSYVHSKSIEGLVDQWHKYCAFNIKRLCDLGTIEFRHFEATQDTAKFSRWLQAIERLYRFNLEVSHDNIFPDSVLYRLYNAISEYPLTWAQIQEKFQDNIANDALCVLNPNKDLIVSRIKQKDVQCVD